MVRRRRLGGRDRQAIYCHPNTVRYRLRRLQQHTGRSLDDPRAVAELLAALDALRLTPGAS
jgi:DNA-binding PucR family transcriptional regulator